MLLINLLKLLQQFDSKSKWKMILFKKPRAYIKLSFKFKLQIAETRSRDRHIFN